MRKPGGVVSAVGVLAFAAMLRGLAILCLAACGKPGTTSRSQVPVASDQVSSEDPTPAAPIIDQTAPPPPTTPPDDHRASATAIYDATNYVAPAELAYSKTLDAVIYPACAGGEGPGEHCGLAAYDRAGKDLAVPPALQVTWYRANDDQTTARTQVIAKLVATLDKLSTYRMDRIAWRGHPAIDLAGFGTVAWSPKDSAVVVSRDGKSSRAAVALADPASGPVNVFWFKEAPVVVVQLRFNPASGGREGYVVFVQLVAVPRP